MKIIATILFMALLGGCSPPAVPDVTYFRMPAAVALPHAEKSLSSLPIEVEVFSADGIYAEQALIYSVTPDASALRTYHYQLWSDPPARALQQRLIGQLRDAAIVPLVTDRLPASEDALRVHGTILRFERIKHDAAFVVSVALALRVEQGNGEPLLEQTYRAEVPAADATLAASVIAFGVAVDQIFTRFYNDLIAFGADAHAG